MSETSRPGFFYGWVVVLSCFLATFCYGFFIVFGVFFKPLQAEFGWSATLTSSIPSLHVAIATLSTLLIGWATDRFNPRLLIAFSGTLIGAGFSLCSQASDLGHFYLFYGMASLGAGALWTLPMAVVQRWFVRGRGLALGIVASGVSVGGIVYATVANSLILTHGWRLAYVILGTGTWVSLMVAAGLVAASPDKKGLKPLGIEEVGTEFTDARANSGSQVWRAGQWNLREVFRTKSFWLLVAIYFCILMPIQMVLVHVVPFAITIGTSETLAARALALMQFLGIAGNIVMGTVAQKTGFRRAMTICVSMCAAMVFWLLMVQGLWMLYPFVIIYGFFCGSSALQVTGLVGYFFPGESMATTLGALSAIAGIGSILGPMVGGFVWDTTGDYQIAFIVGASFWALAAILSYFLKTPEKMAPAWIE